jgi:hypothetical protein
VVARCTPLLDRPRKVPAGERGLEGEALASRDVFCNQLQHQASGAQRRARGIER